jgi:hypothetical protein
MTTYSAWTAAELTVRIAAIKDAIAAAEKGRSYTLEGRSVSRQDLQALRDQLSYYVGELNKLDRSGIRTRRGVMKS